MSVWRVLATLLFLAAPAHASSVINNFIGSVNAANSISKFDATGAQIDIHDGEIIQTGTCPGASCLFTWIGTSYGCQGNPGYVLVSYGSWCGFLSSTSTDLKNWSAQQLIFPVASYLTECSPTFSSPAAGCWNFRLRFNVSSGLWVGWFHDAGASPSTVGIVTCTGLATGCTRATSPSITTNSGVVGSTNLLVDGTDGYIVFTSPNGGGSSVYVQKLNATYTDVVGSAVNVGGSNVEQPSVLKNGSLFYILYGSNCAYCNGTNTTYATASTPLGSWTAHGSDISADSCFGQPEQVNTLTINGATVYLYQVDQYQPSGNENQGHANTYFEQLSFTGSTINNIGCNMTTTIASLTEVPNPVPPADQGDQGSDFQTYCDINSTVWRMQTFVPSSTQTYNIYATSLQGAGAVPGDPNCIFPSGSCPLPDGDLIIGVYNTSANVPTTLVGSATTFTTGNVAWSGRSLLGVTVALIGSTTYAIVLKGSNTKQCYGMAYSDALPYTSGIERVSINSGSSWTTESNRSLKFYTALAATPGRWLFR